MTTLITLPSLSGLPHGDMLSNWGMETEEEVKAWAERNGAETVYIYWQSNGTLTSWIFPKENEHDTENTKHNLG
jgi:hypothetical protein